MAEQHSLPDLPYAYDALEPHYDEQTLRLHHGKHHAGYVAGLNAAEKKLAEISESGDVAAAKAVAKALAFHGCGHLLHCIFWTNMKPSGGGEPTGALAEAINNSFGSYGNFEKLFRGATDTVEGSGWGVLGHRKADDKLLVVQLEKHENFAQLGVTPLLVCDAWEHAYYLKYQNRRPEWTQAFMQHLVNWDDVAQRLEASRA